MVKTLGRIIVRRNLRLVHLEDRLTPSVATWDGGGTDNHWTTAANWVGDIAPQSGDDLVFPSGAAQLGNVNDFAVGTAFASLSVADAGYQVSGNSVSLTAGVSADIPNAGVSTLLLVIGGGGGLSKAGAGTLALSGANTYSGVTTVNAGFLEIQNATALGATGAGNETVVNDGGTLAVRNPPPLLNLLTIDEAITLNGDGAPDQPSGFSGALRTLNAVVEFDGQLTLASDCQFVQFDGSTIIIGHGINEVGGAHSLHLVGARFTFTAASVSTYAGTTFFRRHERGDRTDVLGPWCKPDVCR
jgi:autotransporter-associated beta strand protein